MLYSQIRKLNISPNEYIRIRIPMTPHAHADAHVMILTKKKSSKLIIVKIVGILHNSYDNITSIL